MLSNHSKTNDLFSISINEIADSLESKDSSFQNDPQLDYNKYVKNSCYATDMYFPFNNESEFVYKVSTIGKATVYDAKTPRVAMLTGESNIISILPEIIKHVDFIICNDIDKAVILHTRHMLACLSKANSCKEYLTLYSREHPLDKIKTIKPPISKLKIKDFVKNLKQSQKSSGMLHFLSSEDRFLQCKKIAGNIRIVFTRLNLFDEQSCQIFSNIVLQKAKFTVMGLSNLHDYDSKKVLNNILEKHFHLEKDILILYSTGGIHTGSTLTCHYSRSLKSYQQHLRSERPPLSLSTYSRLKKSVVAANINFYDEKKGVLRQYIYSDSKAIKKIKILQNEMNIIEDNNDAVPHQYLFELKLIIDFYLNKKKSLTNQTLLELHKLIYFNLTGIDPFLLLSIGFYLNKAELVSFGAVNKTNHKLFKLKKGENKEIGLKVKPTHQPLIIYNALIGRLNEYKINRDNKYSVRNIFYKDQALLQHIQNLKNDIWHLANDSQEVDKSKLTPMLGYISNNKQEKYDLEMYLNPSMYFSENFYQFISMMKLNSESKSDTNLNEYDVPDKSTLLLIRLVIEVNYAQKKGHHNFKEVLMSMLNLFLQSKEKDYIQTFYLRRDNAIQKAVKLLEEYKSLAYWNQCYVWKGVADKFRRVTALTAKEANRLYDNGTITREERYWNPSAGGMGEANLSPGGGWEYETVVVREGLDCKLKHFFPYRDRCRVFNDLIAIINKNMLAF